MSKDEKIQLPPELQGIMDDDELKAVMDVDTSLHMPSEEGDKKEITGIESFPRCGTCGQYNYRDDAKGYCRNPEQSRQVWIEELDMPPLTVTKFFGCIEHTDLVEK